MLLKCPLPNVPSSIMKKQLLTRMNNEAKVRRSTKSVVLGKAKVINYKDIEEAQIKRAAKGPTKGKGKRGRKRKSIELEADKPEPDEPDEPDPKPQVARAVKEAINNDGKLAAQEADEPKLEVALMISAPAP